MMELLQPEGTEEWRRLLVLACAIRKGMERSRAYFAFFPLPGSNVEV
jgi:hypothetical protein